MKIVNFRILILLIAAVSTLSIFSQGKYNLNINQDIKKVTTRSTLADSLKKNTFTRKPISAIFLGIGGGLAIPTAVFSETANPAFGFLGRLEFSSTGIFPLVIGGEINYYSFNSPDEFKTTNRYTNYKTKILTIGLNIDYSLSKLVSSSFTMPFVSVDIKTNNINREYDEGREGESLPIREQKISFGAGIGFTVFVLDFMVKYNYMKDNPFVSVTTKIKFPVIRF